MHTQAESIRVDKWLWAARFFKTRSMASKAVNGGKVHLNGSRVKSSKEVKAGDRLLVTKGQMEFDITVLAINRFRRPAPEARLLYEESEESIERRREQRDLRKMYNAGHEAPSRRPDKRDRRKIREFIRKK